MMRKDIKHIKGIGFDDYTDKIVTMLSNTEGVSYAHSVRILIRAAHDMLDIYPDIIYPDIISKYKDGVYNEKI